MKVKIDDVGIPVHARPKIYSKVPLNANQKLEKTKRDLTESRYRKHMFPNFSFSNAALVQWDDYRRLTMMEDLLM